MKPKTMNFLFSLPILIVAFLFSQTRDAMMLNFQNSVSLFLITSAFLVFMELLNYIK